MSLISSFASHARARMNASSHSSHASPTRATRRLSVKSSTNGARALSTRATKDDDLSTPTLKITRAREDDELPDNLFDAVGCAARCTSAAMKRGVAGSVVELLIPELWDPLSGNVMSDSGDQLKVWEISREFMEQLVQNGSKVRAVFPDAGSAAMLKARWGGSECGFDIASVDDRNLVGNDFDGVLVFAAPDPMSLEKVQRATGRANELGCPVVLLNPRLASGDAGVGLNVRRMRDNFLGKMTVTYSLRPLPWCNGSVFKAYPGQWKLFLEDTEEPGRFRLIDEFTQRPAGEELDEIVETALRPLGKDGEAAEKTAAEKVMSVMKDMQRFMKSLSS